MKRVLALTLALVLLLSLGMQAFADDVLYCRMCGKKIPADSRVCQYCGEKVIHTDTTDAAVPEAVPSAEPAPAASAVKSDPSPATASADPGPFSSALRGSSAYGGVRVTKSPTSESVPYGGSCMFIAHADNASSVIWYIANADASVITTVADASNKVSGLYVSGTNRDTLSLSGIPAWMNGCQVQACFSGEGGPVYTEVARIWTYEPAQKVKPCWFYRDWFYPWWADPYTWDWSHNPPPPDVDRAITGPDGTSVAPPIRPGEYVEPAVIVGHTHEVYDRVSNPDPQLSSSSYAFGEPGGPTPPPAELNLPDPSLAG